MVTHTMKEYAVIFWYPTPKALNARRVNAVHFADAIHRSGLIRLLYV